MQVLLNWLLDLALPFSHGQRQQWYQKTDQASSTEVPFA